MAREHVVEYPERSTCVTACITNAVPNEGCSTAVIQRLSN